MIKAWFVCSKDEGTFLTHDDDDVPWEGSADTIIKNGFFVTKEELEEVFKAAREEVSNSDSDLKWDSFEDYMKEKDDE